MIQFNKEKFAELILYIAERTMDDEDFGVIKMAKALWRSDFLAFARFGKPITGASYQKLDYGHAAKQYLPVLEELKRSGEAAEAEQEIGGHHSKRVVALRSINLEIFQSHEIALVDSVIRHLKTRSAKEVSKMSHDTVGWRLADFNEIIPYGTELLPESPLPLSVKEFEYGQHLAESVIRHD